MRFGGIGDAFRKLEVTGKLMGDFLCSFSPPNSCSPWHLLDWILTKFDDGRWTLFVWRRWKCLSMCVCVRACVYVHGRTGEENFRKPKINIINSSNCRSTAHAEKDGTPFECESETVSERDSYSREGTWHARKALTDGRTVGRAHTIRRLSFSGCGGMVLVAIYNFPVF